MIEVIRSEISIIVDGRSTTIEIATALEKYHAIVVSRVGIQANGIPKWSEWNSDMVIVSARRYSLNFHGDMEKFIDTIVSWELHELATRVKVIVSKRFSIDIGSDCRSERE